MATPINDWWRVGRIAANTTLVLTLVGCATTPVFSPSAVEKKIVSVEQWGGTRSDLREVKTQRITHITLHHGGVAFLRDQDPQQNLRNLQSWSRKTRLWRDIPYHYAIDLDGVVYEARDIGVAGDTNTDYDPTGHALIVVLGNFEDVEPNAAQLNAIVETMAMIATKYNVSPEKISGHKNYTLQTACPGKHMVPYLENGYFKREVGRLMALN